MPDPELKPCPFCGGTDLRVYDRGYSWVECRPCEAEGPAADSRESAIAKWNERKGSE